MPITADQWEAARTAVKESGDRFAELVDSVPNPRENATAHWSIADMAAHVVTISSMYTSLVSPDELPPALPALAAVVPDTTVDTVADFNVVALSNFSERDTHVLAQQLRADIELILRSTDGTDPNHTVDWLGGSQLPVGGLLAHLTNELLIHGWDVARTVRRPWEIPPAYAAQFLELFLVGVTRSGYGKLLDSDEPPRDRRIAVEFRSKYTTPMTMVLHKGLVTIEEPRPVARAEGAAIKPDVRLTFDPPAFNLMLFGRMSKARAALTGKVRVGGRRPWLLPAFLKTMRLPS